MLDSIKNRRSIRGYQDKPVPRELLEQLVEAGRWAPSAGNLQPCHFYIVQSRSMLKDMFEKTLNQEPGWQLEAPAAIVVTTEPDVSGQRYGDRGLYLYNIQDSGAATQNIMLAAQSLGLGTCWIGSFNENECSKALGIPERRVPRAIITVGYPSRRPETPPRKELDELTTWIG